MLVDSGSSHNILQLRITHHLHLSITPTTPLFVMVGNDDHNQCQGFCPNIKLRLQDITFAIPLYLLPIELDDIVLAIEWLHTIRPITTDFAIPCILFTCQNAPFTLLGNPHSNPTPSTYPLIFQLVQTNSIASFHLLTF